MASKFSSEDIQLALKVQQTYGVPASVVLGQYALESGYGEHHIGDYNYFNVKDRHGTRGYKDYTSKEEAFMDYGRLVTTERYTKHTSGAKSVREYVAGIKAGGYAEDPNYVNKVMSVIDSNNLTAYDDGERLEGVTVPTTTSLGASGEILRAVFIILLILAAVGIVIMGVNSQSMSIKKEIVKGGVT